jgi:predicted GTPase
LPIFVDPIPNRPELEGYRLVLLDGPGFNDAYQEDEKILKLISEWLRT